MIQVRCGGGHRAHGVLVGTRDASQLIEEHRKTMTPAPDPAARERRPFTWVPPSWPALLGIGIVLVLMFGIVGIDLLIARRLERQTRDLVGNALRSTELLDDLRADTRYLLTMPHDAEEMRILKGKIAEGAREYDPLATFPGEHAEWSKLQALLDSYAGSPTGDALARTNLVESINQSLDRLNRINRHEARIIAEEIRASHRGALTGDAVVGGLTLATMMAVAAMLLHALKRQRALVAERFNVLDEKNAELEAFAARAAHDLRSPLNPVRGYADLILEAKGLPDGVAGMAQHIRRSTERMAGVIDGMLALSVSGRPPPGQSSPVAVVTTVLDELGPELHDVEVLTELSGSPVACHEGVLAQILRNLIGNAKKFREPSRPLRLQITTRDVEDAVEIQVADNGIGMDEEGAKHAFEPFFRAVSSRAIPGHGLGLAIVDRSVRSLGGTTSLISQLDQGTRVVIRLPRPPGPGCRAEALGREPSAREVPGTFERERAEEPPAERAHRSTRLLRRMLAFRHAGK